MRRYRCSVLRAKTMHDFLSERKRRLYLRMIANKKAPCGAFLLELDNFTESETRLSEATG